MGKKGRENPKIRSSSSPGHKSRRPPHVHRDVWWDIFIFLPASSLVRFRAVCKAWRSVIDDPVFARAHIDISSNNTTTTVLIHPYPIAPPFAPYYSVDLDALTPREGLQTIPATPAARPLLRGLPVATCHGLVFEDLEIWNPLFGDPLKLPRGGDDFTLPDRLKVVGGLGYDHATDDYKAVVVDLGNPWRPHPPFTTFVYSLRSNSWRRIGDCPCGRRGPVDRPGIFLSGALHWMSLDDDEIIALDLETEKYRKLLMPPLWESPVDEVTYRRRILGVLDGCLVVTDFCKDDGNCSLKFDAWLLERGSWIKLFSLSHFGYDKILSSYARPLAYIMKNRRLILMGEHSRFYLVDAERELVKRVSIRGIEAGFLSAQLFQESLFRPKDICGVVGGGQRRKKMSSKEKKSKIKTRMMMMEKCNTDLCFCISDYLRH